MLRLLRFSAKNGALSSPGISSCVPPSDRERSPVGWLDLDDVGAEVGELHRAEGTAHDLREVDDADAVEGESHEGYSRSSAPAALSLALSGNRISCMSSDRHSFAMLLLVAFTIVLPSVNDVGAQSDIAFPPSVYAERRTRLANTLGESVIVVPGRYLINPGDGLVRQDPNFWYLTGVESPYAILVMRVGAAGAAGPRVRSSLFLPTAYQFAGGQLPMLDEPFRRAVWNRPRRRLVPGPETARLTLVDETIPVDSFVPRFREIAKGVTTIYVPDAAALYAPPGLIAPKSLEDQLSSQLATLAPGAKLADAGPALEQMRLIKDSHEIEALRRSASISATGMREAMAKLRPGMNDRELAGFMEYVWKREGSNRASLSADRVVRA